MMLYESKALFSLEIFVCNIFISKLGEATGSRLIRCVQKNSSGRTGYDTGKGDLRLQDLKTLCLPDFFPLGALSE